MEAARTCPATLAGAETTRRSSSMPMARMTMAATARPKGSEDSNTGPKPGMNRATAKATSRAISMATPPSVGVGRSWMRRSSGLTTAPQRCDMRQTAGVRTNVTTAATPKTTPYRSTRSAGVGPELRAEVVGRVPDVGQSGVVVAVPQGAADEGGDLAHLGLPHPGRGDRRGADAQPAGDERRPGIAGDGVLVQGDPGPVEHVLGHLAGQRHVGPPEVDQHQVVVRAGRDQPEALAGQ